MSYTIKRPLSPSERLLAKRLEKAEAIAGTYFSENLILRARIRNMIEGHDWRRRLARWLICQAEAIDARRVARFATEKGGDDSVQNLPTDK